MNPENNRQRLRPRKLFVKHDLEMLVLHRGFVEMQITHLDRLHGKLAMDDELNMRRKRGGSYTAAVDKRRVALQISGLEVKLERLRESINEKRKEFPNTL
jgi:hypothetical protein